MNPRFFLLALSTLLGAASTALHAQHASHPTPPGAYAGQQQRAIKALSAEEQQAFLSGAGAGFAKAAELNHYPGPMHVLELADALSLSATQREQSERLLHAHKTQARALGAQVVAAEGALDHLFSTGSPSAEALAAAVSAAGQANAAYRLSHLQAHLAQTALLSAAQVAEYDRLRGYGGTPR